MFKVFTFIILVIACLWAYNNHTTKETNKRLTSFVGATAKTNWTESMSNGEDRHYTVLANCTAVIGEKDNQIYYLSRSFCQAKEQ